MQRFFTISNILSITRAVLSIPFVLIMRSDSPNARLWGLALLGIAALTDKLDGVLARRYNQITEWGKILDPLADKIGIAVVAIVLVQLGQIPDWFLLAIVTRDLLILAGGMYLKRKRGVVEQSNLVGKWTIGVLAATMGLAMLNADAVVVNAAVWFSVAMLIASLGMYTVVFVKVLRRTST